MVYKGYMYGTLLVSDLSISFSIFLVVVFSWLFLRHDGYIYLWTRVFHSTCVPTRWARLAFFVLLFENHLKNNGLESPLIFVLF